MAGPDLKAEAGALKKAEGIVNRYYGKFNSDAKALMDDIDSVKAGWQGRGGDAFTNLHMQWQEKQKTIVSALTKFEQALGQTDKKVTGTDHTTGLAVTKVGQMLDNVKNS